MGDLSRNYEICQKITPRASIYSTGMVDLFSTLFPASTLCLFVKNNLTRVLTYILIIELGLFGTLKLALALQFIVTNAYFSVARTLTLVLHATLK